MPKFKYTFFDISSYSKLKLLESACNFKTSVHFFQYKISTSKIKRLIWKWVKTVLLHLFLPFLLWRMQWHGLFLPSLFSWSRTWILSILKLKFTKCFYIKLSHFFNDGFKWLYISFQYGPEKKKKKNIPIPCAH